NEAIEKYEAAVELWDHPGIYFNLSLALKATNEPIRAYSNVRKALDGDLAALGADGEARQRNRQRMEELERELRAQLTELRVIAALDDKPAIIVDDRALDPVAGQDPAAKPDPRRLFLPGRHRMIVQQEGYRDAVVTLDLQPGETRLFTVEGGRRMAAWQPYVIFGSGLIVGTVGAVLYRGAIDDHDALEMTVNSTCTPGGCVDSEASSFSSDWSGIRLREGLGLTALAVGVVATITGGGLVLWNQQKRFRITPRTDGVAGTWTF
ncbi:MAG: hypothetical protein AAGC55_22710, partial [Myxococcota bacterium]